MNLPFFVNQFNFPCVSDSDCKASNLPDYNSLFCVSGQCQKLVGTGNNCIVPEQCSSFSYFGPLACSSTCKTGKDCNRPYIEKTSFCCKAIPRLGTCNLNRPGILSGCNSSEICSLEGGKPICVDKKEKMWLLSAICSVAGNVLINIGINFQKKSYKQSFIAVTPFVFNTMVFGSVIYFIGKVISYIAYIFGTQSMLAGLSAVGLISNSIFAPLINSEVFTYKDVIAIILIFIGTSVMMVNTSASHVVYSVCELIKMYRRPPSILWFSCLIFLIAFFYLFIKFVEVNSDWGLINDRFTFLQTNVYFDENGFVCKYIMIFAYIFLGSFIACFTTLSAKSLGEIIGKSLGGDHIKSNLTYFFIFSLFLCTILQIYWINRALKHFDALLVVPLFHISWTLLSIVTASIYFQDFDHFSRIQLNRFIFGILIIILGSGFLMLRIVNKNVVKTREIEIPSTQYTKSE